MRIEAGRPQYYNGLRISVEMPQPVKRAIPSGTAWHEGMHVAGAIINRTEVKSATIVVGDGYSGLTELAAPDAVAAMAPHSMGASGTRHDVFVAGLIGNASAAESTARGIIQANMDIVEAVATVLEEKRTIGSSDIHRAIDEVRNPKPKIATLSIEGKSGERREEKVEVKGNTVMFPGEWVTFGRPSVPQEELQQAA